ncbi:FxLD family lanthipeptide [Nocardiopsis baichengensis]|uniref:FxLD family lanthipeptide n=1 Tax=Nocardiopsis baichengensis TaxID=280240 RepID=UPI00034A7806|nr:FxLD family lanthipeptide [Nocardiopsis baichengensis]
MAVAPSPSVVSRAAGDPAPPLSAADVWGEGFELNVRLVAEAVPPDGLVPCDTSDGCGQTCESACANSNG